MYRVYMPEEYYWRPEGHGAFYGQIRETNQAGCKVFHIVSRSKDRDSLEMIGQIDGAEGIAELHNKPTIHFTKDSKEQGKLILKKVQDPHLDTSNATVQLVLYNRRTFTHLADSTSHKDSEFSAELMHLANLQVSSNKTSSGTCDMPSKSPDRVNILTRMVSCLSLALLPLTLMFQKTAVAQHFQEWKIIFKYRGGMSHLKRNILPILLDVFLGLIIMIMITQKTNPGAYLMTVTHEIIVQLRKLLESLRGSPVGLKINIQLNDFLLNCFMYHINLWRAFLDIVSPAINYLFAILSIFGLCGFSFQLAMLSDLLVLITIHAHCFYIYAAVLYRLEIVGLKALWRVVVGRRKNVLKNRVEAYDYKHSQLFLATLFFSSLLFLLPTVLVYYVVFSTVRLVMYCIIFTLLIARRKLLELPIYDSFRYLFGTHLSPDNVVIEIVDGAESTMTSAAAESSRVTVVRIKPGRSPLRNKIPNDVFDTKYPSILEFLTDLMKGEIKGFIRPNSETAADANVIR